MKKFLELLKAFADGVWFCCKKSIDGRTDCRPSGYHEILERKD